MKTSAIRKGVTLDYLVPYGPGLGSASTIMKGLFELTGSMGTTNITSIHLLIYLFEKGTDDERKAISELFGFKSTDDIKKRFGRLPSKMLGTQKVSLDQITISREVQLIFRRAKQISDMLRDRYIGHKHLLIAIFKECELNHHTCPELSSLMADRGITSHKILERLKKL